MQCRMVFITLSPLCVELLCDDVELHCDDGHGGVGNMQGYVGANAPHHRFDSLVLNDVKSALRGALILGGLSGGHHHATTNSVKGVTNHSGRDTNAGRQEQEESTV